VETPLTPAEIAENERIKNMPVIKELHSDLEGLKEGQEKLNDKVDSGFEKGRKRMDSMEVDIKEIKNIILAGEKKRDEQHNETLRTISDNEIIRLQKKIEERDAEVKTNDSRVWEVTKIGLTAIVSIVITILLVKFGLK